MKSFGSKVVKARFVILIAAIVLIFPALLGMARTRVNYDMLTYLPKEIDTMKGQDILIDQFGTGGVSMIVVEGMDNKDISALRQKIEDVDGVKDAFWYDSFMDLSVPIDILPDEIKDAFIKDDSTMIIVTYEEGTSADRSLDAVTNIRKIVNEKCFVSGVTAVCLDTKELAEQEEPIYILIAVVLASIVLALACDTFLAPVFFLLSIGLSILYNMGTNIFLGQVSYVTKALAAILQLGVTMDYSIFLWSSFEENMQKYPDDKKHAMAEAINATLQSVIGSSVTTIAGFAALCFMSFTLGLDIGLVMMKGVALGVVGCVTILPSMILIFDNAIEKTHHRPIIPAFKKLPGFVQKHYVALLIVFAIAWIPAIYGDTHVNVYYNLDRTLPTDLPGIVANEKLKDDFDLSNTMFVLSDSNLPTAKTSEMCKEIENVDGVNSVLGMDALLGGGIPRDALPKKIKDALESDEYELTLINSSYKVASHDVNVQINAINKILKKYDSKAMLIGEAPATKDLIRISNHDFNTVNWVSIGIIAVIIAFVFKSAILPFLLVLVIECAIFINMSISYYTGVTLPFIANIVIGTVQLGSTVDYAILMTSRYQTERYSGKDKWEAIKIAHSTSITSIITSALTFFASTFGVAIYSNIEMISSLCLLMARGALISALIVLTILPAVLYAFDPIIVRLSVGFVHHPGKFEKHQKKVRQRKAKEALETAKVEDPQ
ncbi:MAG: MMPL family transporter [Lachnospiraceae bacterium]|nr:MMPL family transporter [Lachnospiraceae bacterium]